MGTRVKLTPPLGSGRGSKAGRGPFPSMTPPARSPNPYD